MNRAFAALAVVVVGVMLAGCTPGPGSATTSMAGATERSDTVDHQGLADIRFGDARGQLERDHDLTQTEADCAPRLPGQPTASPVFDGERLVLLWADPPLHTPEGVGVGATVTQVQQTYPDAEVLTAPAETYQFDGLLVTDTDRAYLFLHDGRWVQKLIVGYAEHARLLFDEGFGTC